MLSNILNTNEIKDASATEVEFSRISTVGRTTEFAKVGEVPYLPHRLKVSHQETGQNSNKRRRSVVRFDKTILAADNVTPVTVSAYAVLDSPTGSLATATEEKNVIAELMSFLASLGASTTILYDCTGNGAVCLVDGSL